MNNRVNFSTLNFNKNIFTLREKITQDLSLKSSLYNISKRRPIYGCNNNAYIKYERPYSPRNSLKNFYGVDRKQTNTSYKSIKTSPHRVTSTSRGYSPNQTSPSRKNSYYRPSSPSRCKTFSLSESLLQSREKVKRIQRLQLQKDNHIFNQRLKRVSSPLSRKNLDALFEKNRRYKNIIRTVRTNNEMKERERLVINKLPVLYNKNIRFGCY